MNVSRKSVTVLSTVVSEIARFQDFFFVKSVQHFLQDVRINIWHISLLHLFFLTRNNLVTSTEKSSVLRSTLHLSKSERNSWLVFRFIIYKELKQIKMNNIIYNWKISVDAGIWRNKGDFPKIYFRLFT